MSWRDPVVRRGKADESRAAALALAEFEDAFEKPSNALGSSMRGFGPGRGGFVRAGGQLLAYCSPSSRADVCPGGTVGAPYEPPRAPAAMLPTGPSGPPKGPAAMGYARVRDASAVRSDQS